MISATKNSTERHLHGEQQMTKPATGSLLDITVVRASSLNGYIPPAKRGFGFEDISPQHLRRSEAREAMSGNKVFALAWERVVTH